MQQKDAPPCILHSELRANTFEGSQDDFVFYFHFFHLKKRGISVQLKGIHTTTLMFEITCHKSHIQYSQMLGGLLYSLNYLHSVLSLRPQSKCRADIFCHMLLTCAHTICQVSVTSALCEPDHTES